MKNIYMYIYVKYIRIYKCQSVACSNVYHCSHLRANVQSFFFLQQFIMTSEGAQVCGCILQHIWIYSVQNVVLKCIYNMMRDCSYLINRLLMRWCNPSYLHMSSFFRMWTGKVWHHHKAVVMTSSAAWLARSSSGYDPTPKGWGGWCRDNQYIANQQICQETNHNRIQICLGKNHHRIQICQGTDHHRIQTCGHWTLVIIHPTLT